MSDRKRQRYTTAFKAEAVRLVLEGDRSAAAAGRGAEPARELTERERVRQLERELAVVRQERDFLKKATAFFARTAS